MEAAFLAFLASAVDPVRLLPMALLGGFARRRRGVVIGALAWSVVLYLTVRWMGGNPNPIAGLLASLFGGFLVFEVKQVFFAKRLAVAANSTQSGPD